MQIKKILALIDELDVKLAVLLCHNNADPDAICAAFAFKRLLNRLKPNLEIEITVASGPSRLSKSLLTVLPIEINDKPRIETADILVLLDTNTIQQLDEMSKKITPNQPLLVIDHHAKHPETEKIATLSVIDEKASSTCEIIYHLFKEAKILPSLQVAKALFLGIAFDTRHFIIATSKTLKVVADLVDAGVNAQETLPMLSLPMEYSERIARLKACERVKILTIKDLVIVVTNVSAYQASAARALVTLGAHVAIVAGKKEDKIQVSLRASRDFYKRTDFHLGRDLAKPLGEFLEGMGGGHSVSAGANGTGEITTCLDFCTNLLKNSI